MADRVGGASGFFIYGRSWQTAAVIAFMISWGMMNLLAITFERRTMINPLVQAKGFWFGDLICLPGLVLVLRHLSHQVGDGHHWWQNPAWHVLCLTVGLLVGAIFHHMERGAYRPTQLQSPTKLYHDFVVFTLFIYVLFSAAPVIFAASGGVTPRLVVIGLILMFLLLNLLDIKDPHPNRWHVDWVPWHRVHYTGPAS